jgi:uncharacterized protein (TIRG00374 family)
MKNKLSWVLKALITSGLLYYIFNTIPVAEIVPTIASARIHFFAMAFLLVLLMNYVSSCRMKLLTDRHGMTVTRRRIFEINLIANFYGLFLPGSLAGGAIRWNKLYKIDKNGTGAFVAIIFNRTILTTATAATGVVCWALSGNYRTNNAAGLSLVGILAILLVLQGGMIHGRIFPWVEGFLDGRYRMPEALQSKFGKLILSLNQYRDLPFTSLLWLAALSFTEEFLGIVSYYFVSLAIGMEVPFVHLGWIRSCILIVTMLPISLSGFGVREGTLIALLAPYGVSGTMAVAFSLLLFARSLLYAAIGGVLETANLLFPTRRKTIEDT